MAYHASPKFMAPRHSGDTRTPAVGARMRCHASKVSGLGTAGNDMIAWVCLDIEVSMVEYLERFLYIHIPTEKDRDRLSVRIICGLKTRVFLVCFQATYYPDGETGSSLSQRGSMM